MKKYKKNNEQKFIKIADNFNTLVDFFKNIKGPLFIFAGLGIFGFIKISKFFTKLKIPKIGVYIIAGESIIIIVLLLTIMRCVWCIHKIKKNGLYESKKIIEKESIADVEFYEHYIKEVLLPEKEGEQRKLYDNIQSGMFIIDGEAVKRHQSQMMRNFIRAILYVQQI